MAAAEEVETPIARAVEKNRDELQSMLDDLRAMRKLID